MYIKSDRFLIKTKFIRCIALILFLFCVATLPANAEIQTITSIAEYTMVEGETLPVAKERALAEAVKSAAEQAGVYVESYSRTSNLVLTKDEVNILSLGMVEVLEKHYDEPQYSGKICTLRVTITARVDTGNIEESRRMLQSKLLAVDLKRVQAAYEDCQQDIMRLKEQLAQASGNEKKDIVQRIADNEKRYRVASLIRQGYNLVIQKNYEASIQAFTQAINLDPHYAFAYANRGNTYHEWKQLDLALADYDKAIALDPTDDAAYYNRGLLYSKLNRYDLERADYDKAITINPNNIYALNNRGIAYAKAAQYNLALADYNKVITIDPNNAYAYDNRGNAYFELRQYYQALADYEESIRLDPSNKSAYQNRGQIKSVFKQYGPAIADFNQAILLGANTTHIYRVRGMAYHQLMQYQEAITDYDKAIELDPSIAITYYYRGVSKYGLKQFEAAIADCDKAIELKPGQLGGAPYFYKGVSLAYLQRSQEAIEALRLYIRYGNEAGRIEMAKNFIRQLGDTP
jgi:tetratricopeptide (TPR) repeat protein